MFFETYNILSHSNLQNVELIKTHLSVLEISAQSVLVTVINNIRSSFDHSFIGLTWML